MKDLTPVQQSPDARERQAEFKLQSLITAENLPIIEVRALIQTLLNENPDANKIVALCDFLLKLPHDKLSLLFLDSLRKDLEKGIYAFITNEKPLFEFTQDPQIVINFQKALSKLCDLEIIVDSKLRQAILDFSLKCLVRIVELKCSIQQISDSFALLTMLAEMRIKAAITSEINFSNIMQYLLSKDPSLKILLNVLLGFAKMDCKQEDVFVMAFKKLSEIWNNCKISASILQAQQVLAYCERIRKWDNPAWKFCKELKAPSNIEKYKHQEFYRHLESNLRGLEVVSQTKDVEIKDSLLQEGFLIATPIIAKKANGAVIKLCVLISEPASKHTRNSRPCFKNPLKQAYLEATEWKIIYIRPVAKDLKVLVPQAVDKILTCLRNNAVIRLKEEKQESQQQSTPEQDLIVIDDEVQFFNQICLVFEEIPKVRQFAALEKKEDAVVKTIQFVQNNQKLLEIKNIARLVRLLRVEHHRSDSSIFKSMLKMVLNFAVIKNPSSINYIKIDSKSFSELFFNIAILFHKRVLSENISKEHLIILINNFLNLDTVKAVDIGKLLVGVGILIESKKLQAADIPVEVISSFISILKHENFNERMPGISRVLSGLAMMVRHYVVPAKSINSNLIIRLLQSSPLTTPYPQIIPRILLSVVTFLKFDVISASQVPVEKIIALVSRLIEINKVGTKHTIKAIFHLGELATLKVFKRSQALTNTCLNLLHTLLDFDVDILNLYDLIRGLNSLVNACLIRAEEIPVEILQELIDYAVHEYGGKNYTLIQIAHMLFVSIALQNFSLLKSIFAGIHHANSLSKDNFTLLRAVLNQAMKLGMIRSPSDLMGLAFSAELDKSQTASAQNASPKHSLADIDGPEEKLSEKRGVFNPHNEKYIIPKGGVPYEIKFNATEALMIEMLQNLGGCCIFVGSISLRMMREALQIDTPTNVHDVDIITELDKDKVLAAFENAKDFEIIPMQHLDKVVRVCYKQKITFDISCGVEVHDLVTEAAGRDGPQVYIVAKTPKVGIAIDPTGNGESSIKQGVIHPNTNNATEKLHANPMLALRWINSFVAQGLTYELVLEALNGFYQYVGTHPLCNGEDNDFQKMLAKLRIYLTHGQAKNFLTEMLRFKILEVVFEFREPIPSKYTNWLLTKLSKFDEIADRYDEKGKSSDLFSQIMDNFLALYCFLKTKELKPSIPTMRKVIEGSNFFNKFYVKRPLNVNVFNPLFKELHEILTPKAAPKSAAALVKPIFVMRSAAAGAAVSENEHKQKPAAPAVNFARLFQARESEDKQVHNVLSKETATKTRAEGDCAFHAILGSWNSVSKMYESNEIVEQRKAVAEAIIVSEMDDLNSIIVDAIQQQIFAPHRMSGPAITAVKNAYKKWDVIHEVKLQFAWIKLETALLRNENIIKFIKQHSKEANLRAKFNDCIKYPAFTEMLNKLNHTDQTLINEYNAVTLESFDWNKALLTPKVREEYAAFMSRPNQWLLPCELKLIAHVFNIQVRYYNRDSRDDSYRLQGNLNSNLPGGESNAVYVGFNGKDHYDRLEPQKNVVAAAAAVALKATR